MSFYCEKRVKKGRKAKTCSMCGKPIAVGESSLSIPTECFEITVVLCTECEATCEVSGINQVGDIPRYDD